MSIDSAEDCFQRAREYFTDENYDDALTEFTSAIELDNQNPAFFIERAACFLKLKQHLNALKDCHKSLDLKPDGRLAHFRSALAHWNLGDYENAKKSFEKARELGQKKCEIWIRKCDAEIEDAANPAGEVQKRKKKKVMAQPTSSSQDVQMEVAPRMPAGPSSTTVTARSKIRTSYIQSTQRLTFSIFCKNLNRKDVEVNFSELKFSVIISLPDGSTYQKEWNLFNKINPAGCKFTVNKYKVQIFLKKLNPGNWETLEPINKKADVKERANEFGEADATAYPSSGKKHINWEELDREQRTAEKEEKPEGDGALNKMFQDIYSSGSSEQRRAMVKSMQTSGGTVLSTNWEEVQDQNYEDSIKAPDGQEVHKWNEM